MISMQSAMQSELANAMTVRLPQRRTSEGVVYGLVHAKDFAGWALRPTWQRATAGWWGFIQAARKFTKIGSLLPSHLRAIPQRGVACGVCSGAHSGGIPLWRRDRQMVRGNCP